MSGPRRVRRLPNALRPALLAAGRSPRLGRLVARLPLSRAVVRRFVPGETRTDVLATVDALVADGRLVSVDHLGEDTTDVAQADATVQAYLDLLDAWAQRPIAAGPVPRREVSVKLSALGQALPGDGPAVSVARARRICAAAERAGAWVTVDMEDHTTTDATLAAVAELRRDHPDVGVVLQAYLRRTEDDCRALAVAGSRVRLCKGAYAEPEEVAFTRREEVDASYLRCLEVLVRGDGYPMVASHDPAMIERALALVAETGRGPGDYELQMLYGVRDPEQRRLAAEGHPLRVYLPYGRQWYGYFMRRLAERPANLAFFLRSLLP